MTADLAAIRARHVPHTDGSYRCIECDRGWPCDTAIVLAALDDARMERDSETSVAVDAEHRLTAAIEREARLRAAIQEAVNLWKRPTLGATTANGLRGAMEANCSQAMVMVYAALATTPASAPVEPTAEGK